MPTDSYEAKPRKDIAERLSCAAHVSTPPFSDEGRGGTPELVKLDWMAACSASGDPLGEAACMAKYCEANNLSHIVDLLHKWGWQRWGESDRQGSINTGGHRRMVKLAISEFLDTGPLTSSQRIKALSVKPKQWGLLKDHYRDLVSRLLSGENRVLWHIGRMVK